MECSYSSKTEKREQMNIETLSFALNIKTLLKGSEPTKQHPKNVFYSKCFMIHDKNETRETFFCTMAMHRARAFV